MKKYFYSDGANKLGPFMLEELKEIGISRETKVWLAEAGEWQKAEDMEDLKELFAVETPLLSAVNDDVEQSDSRKDKIDTIDILVFVSVAYWTTVSFANLVIQKVDHNWNNKPVKYLVIITNIIFAVVPIIFALSVSNKTLKMGAIFLGALLSLYMLYSNVGWLTRELKLTIL